jgi:phosphate transport system substrate-binding protein
MKTFFTKISLIVALAIIGGCSEQPAETIVIRGSNTFCEELAPRLRDVYTAAHPNVKIDMEFKGTPYGLGALMVDRCDIAASSRLVTTNEVELAKDRNVEFTDHLVGYYSAAVVVNSKNPLSNLTKQQVRDIFTGAVKNWNEVGGPDAPIKLYIRNPVSGTHLGFQELALGTNAYAIGVKTYLDYNTLDRAVAADPNGIGYSSFTESSKTGVKMVSIDNIQPSNQNVQKASYPYARPLHLYTNKNKDRKTADDFVDFVTSTTGQRILAEMDFIPHP